MKWWYQRTKIVAWPRHKRIAILGLKAAMHLLRTAVGGDNDALACYTDAATLQQASVEVRSMFTSKLRDQCIAAIAQQLISMEACVAFAHKMKLNTARVHRRITPLREDLHRHGCSALRAPLVHVVAQSAAAFEEGAQKA